MRQQVGSVLLALVLAFGLLGTLLYGQDRPTARGGDTRRPAAPAALHPSSGRPAESATDALPMPTTPGPSGRLVVLDVSDPARPVAVGQSVPLWSMPRGVAVADGYAYVSDPATGLHVLDVGHPEVPTPVGRIDTLRLARGLVLVGHAANSW
jgi:hypothetical protein